MNKITFELNPNGHKYDSFSQIITTVGSLLGTNIDYDDVCALSTIAFAPALNLGESCTAWWNMEKAPSMDVVSTATGLQFKKLPINPEWTDEQIVEHRIESAPIIQNAIDAEKIVITAGGWSNPPDKSFAPWCFWGIITQADNKGNITGITLNNRNDNEIKWLGDCWAVSHETKASISDANKRMLQHALARIRSDKESNLVFGLEAMDKWIEQMNKRPFCPDCVASAPDREWTCANSTAEPVYSDAQTVSNYLRKQPPSPIEAIQKNLEAIANHYDRIAELLEPSLTPDTTTHYSNIIGDIDKQKEHAEIVLLPIKTEMSKAANAIENGIDFSRITLSITQT